MTANIFGRYWKLAVLALGLVSTALCVIVISRWYARRVGGGDLLKTQVERRAFEDVIRGRGALVPMTTVDIKSKVKGSLLHLVVNGARVEQGALLAEIDPKPHEEALTKHDANLRKLKAERVKEAQTAAKELRKTQDDIESRALRADLESLRLKELEQGPAVSEALEVRVALGNAQNLFQARKEEYSILLELSGEGYVSQTEVRQKELDLREQELKVAEAELKQRKLYTRDPIKIAEQKLKARDEQKNLEAAKERARVIEHSNQQADERFAVNLKREDMRRTELVDNLKNTKILAPTPGVALIGNHWGTPYGPGQEVQPRWELLNLTDLRRMKAVLAVDEGRIGRVVKGQSALIRPSGSKAQVFHGKVVRVAEKGRDEFEDFRKETQSLVGRANRQVFDVEVELDGESPLLRPGLRVDVEIVIDRIDNALQAPRAALVRTTGANPYVRVATAQGAERRTVKVLAENELYCVLEPRTADGQDGVEEGESLVVEKP